MQATKTTIFNLVVLLCCFFLSPEHVFASVDVESENKVSLHGRNYLIGFSGVPVLSIRTGPSIKSKKIAHLSSRDFVFIVGEENGWYKIYQPSGITTYYDPVSEEPNNDKVGYVSSKYIHDNFIAAITTNQGKQIPLYDQRSFDGQIVDKLNDDREIFVKNILDDGWGETVVYPNKRLFIHTKYIKQIEIIISGIPATPEDNKFKKDMRSLWASYLAYLENPTGENKRPVPTARKVHRFTQMDILLAIIFLPIVFLIPIFWAYYSKKYGATLASGYFLVPAVLFGLSFFFFYKQIHGIPAEETEWRYKIKTRNQLGYYRINGEKKYSSKIHIVCEPDIPYTFYSERAYHSVQFDNRKRTHEDYGFEFLGTKSGRWLTTTFKKKTRVVLKPGIYKGWITWYGEVRIYKNLQRHNANYVEF